VFAQATWPYNFLVQSRLDGQPLGYLDPLYTRRHDWGPGDHPVSGDTPEPLGYQASDNVMLWPGAVGQTWSYRANGQNPGKFVRANGDGGQIIVVSGDTAWFWATQDTSYPGLQYIVGTVCPGGDGWRLFDAGLKNNAVTSWVYKVSALSVSKVSSTDCPPLAPALNRFMRGPVTFPFKTSGWPTYSQTLDTILTEHYERDTIAASVNMERNFFARGLGNLYWQAWSTTVEPGADLDARCPAIIINGYYYPEVPGWHLVNCRYWTNLVPAIPFFTMNTYGWPYVQ
jgi:hypothetical protein